MRERIFRFDIKKSRFVVTLTLGILNAIPTYLTSIKSGDNPVQAIGESTIGGLYISALTLAAYRLSDWSKKV